DLDDQLAAPREVKDIVKRHRNRDRSGDGHRLPAIRDRSTEDRDCDSEAEEQRDAAKARSGMWMNVAVVVRFSDRAEASRQHDGSRNRRPRHAAGDQERQDRRNPRARVADHEAEVWRYGSGNRLQSARLRSRTATRVASSSRPRNISVIRSAISTISGSAIPRDVTDGVPRRIPFGLNGVPPWPGNVLAFTVIPTSSNAVWTARPRSP